MKICKRCKEEKQLICFNKHTQTKDNLQQNCKECSNFLAKENYVKNKEKIMLRHNSYYLKNKIKLKLNVNKAQKAINSKNWALKNKEKIKTRAAKYYVNNKDKIKQYSFENKEKRNKQFKYRKDNNPLIKLKCNIRTLIWQSIKKNGYTKKSESYKILGCSFDYFKQHLESLFTTDMNWENQGQWHIDHIYPVSLAKDEEELIRLNHYTNLQPLWAFDNLSKGNKIIEKQLILI